jgi:hypothetical protein
MNESCETKGPNEEVPPDIPGLDLVRKIGSGAYGQVWLARNKVTGHLVAVKVVPLVPLEGADRAGRETTSLIHYEVNRRKQHENLLPIYHVGQTEDMLFYTMEPADDIRGRPASLDPDYRPSSLAARLESGSMQPEESFRCAQELLNGLVCLHDAGMAHRDVKPANCLFVDGKLKLADFGLLTKTDAMVSLVGTPRYMPPDKHMDARADVYAAGLVIYEMFTGLPASSFPRWNAESVGQMGKPILTALNRVVLRACQPDPDKRFPNATAMLGALETQRRTMQPSRASAIMKLGVVVGLGLAVMAVVTGWLLSNRYEKAVELGRTEVNFVTTPFEAEVYLDGIRACDGTGKPCTTPCTVMSVPMRSQRVVFKKNGLADLDIGVVDFSRQREVEARWNSTTPP